MTLNYDLETCDYQQLRLRRYLGIFIRNIHRANKFSSNYHPLPEMEVNGNYYHNKGGGVSM